MWVFPFVMLMQVDAGETLHLAQNPVYKELRETGIAVTAKNLMPLPKPYLADGLDHKAQRKLIEKLGGRRYPWALLTRNSTVAPQIIQLSEQKLPGSDTKARIAHVYFIAYGDMEEIAKSGTLTQPNDDGDKEWKTLTEKVLAAKNLVLDEKGRESYGSISNNLIDRVRLTGVLRTYWSQSEESLIASAYLDPKFNGDADFPNRWQAMDRGKKPVGEPAAYQGAGGYTKITKLAEPEGALFVESHLVFAEPHAWFDGANLLGSKLPAVIQHEVRNTRQEILKASGDQ